MKLHHSIIDLLPKRLELTYVDYRDNLDNSTDEIQQAIQSQDWYPLDDAIGEDWILDQEWESIKAIKAELLQDMVNEFDVSEERAESFIEKYDDWIRDEIYSRDNSTVLKDLLRNTSDPVTFYDTGYEIPEETCFLTDKEFKAYMRQVKKAIGIKAKELKYDKSILELLVNASYGGRLVIYFTADVNQFMSIAENGHTKITFENPHIALIDTCNGSGHDVQLQGHKFTLPLDTTNIFLDKTLHYSYTYDVCGMSSNWCDNTKVTFQKGRAKSASKSSLHAELDQEKRYKETFKAGKCTPLDMDMQRHRDVFYINDFPCGSKCPHCGTFWID